jgi:hypothetical protein
MRTSLRLTMLTLIALTTGCVRAQATMLVPGIGHPPVPPEQVEVYLGEDELPEGCQRITLIHAAGDANLTNETRMIAAARKRAGRSGANAVVVRSIRDPSTGTRVAAAVFGIPAERKGQIFGYRCPAPEAW